MQQVGPPRGDFRIRSLVLSVYLPTFLFAVGQGAVIPMIPLFAKHLGASVAVAGLIVSFNGIGTMLFDIPAGILVSRFGERWTMLVGTAALAVVAVGAGFSRVPAQFAVLVLFMGCSWAIWQLARLSYVTDLAPIEQRGRALSVLGGSNRVGNFVGPFLGGFAAERFGFQAAFSLQAVLATAGALTLFFLVRETGAGRPTRDGTAYQRFTGVLRNHRRIFLTAGVSTLAIQMLRTARQAVVPLWGDAIGLGPAQIGIVFGLSSAMDMVMFYPVGMVMDRWGRKWVGVPCLLLLSAGLALVPTTHGLWPLVLVGLLAGFGNGLGSGIVMTLGADFSPASRRGEFLGVWRLVGDVGAAAGPMLIGIIVGVATLGAASVAVAGVGVAGALLMAFGFPEPLRRPAAPARPPRR